MNKDNTSFIMPSHQNLSGPVYSQPPDIGLDSSQLLEQVLVGRLLDVRGVEIQGKYSQDSNGNLIPVYEHVNETKVTDDGMSVNLVREVYYTMPDGTSLGEYVECMNCGKHVSKENISRCPICKKTVCVICGKFAQSGTGYCSGWHKFLGGDGLF